MGECLVNTDNFLIDNSDIEMAQNICKNDYQYRGKK